MRIGLVACFSMALMFSAPTAFAQSKSLAVVKVFAEQTRLRSELEAGSGRASRISPARRADLLERQQELLDLLQGKQSASELSESQQAYARDTLALIEAAVEDDNDERVVCKREKSLGSNMVTRSCRTVSQMRLDQERAREAVMEMSRD